MIKQGIMEICERCGVQRFRSYHKETKFTDGGYTSYDVNVYDEEELDWPTGYNEDGKKVDLCPACGKQYRELLQDFFSQEDEKQNA